MRVVYNLEWHHFTLLAFIMTQANTNLSVTVNSLLVVKESTDAFVLELARVLLPASEVVIFSDWPTARLLVLLRQLRPGIIELFEIQAPIVILKGRSALDRCPTIWVRERVSNHVEGSFALTLRPRAAAHELENLRLLEFVRALLAFVSKLVRVLKDADVRIDFEFGVCTSA